MAKKKKKERDFQKTKLRVGRRLIGATNDTKTEFKSKKIILKEMESRSKDPIKTLSNSYGLNTQMKISCLSGVNNWINSTNVMAKSGEVVNTVCKYLNDCDQRVRNDCIKCLKHCMTLLHNNNKSGSVSPLMPIILTYINCGLTHIDSNISNDSLKLLSHFMDFCDHSLFNQLMQIINSRISNKSNIDSQDLEICFKLVSLMAKSEQNSLASKPKDSAVMKWSTDNCYCNLNAISAKKPSYELNLSFQTSSSVDAKEKFYKTLEGIVRNELKTLFSKDGNHLSFSVNEARKAIFVLKISSTIGLPFETKQEMPSFSITAINANKKSNQKQQNLILHLNNELNTCVKHFLNKTSV